MWRVRSCERRAHNYLACNKATGFVGATPLHLCRGKSFCAWSGCRVSRNLSLTSTATCLKTTSTFLANVPGPNQEAFLQWLEYRASVELGPPSQYPVSQVQDGAVNAGLDLLQNYR